MCWLSWYLIMTCMTNIHNNTSMYINVIPGVRSQQWYNDCSYNMTNDYIHKFITHLLYYYFITFVTSTWRSNSASQVAILYCMYAHMTTDWSHVTHFLITLYHSLGYLFMWSSKYAWCNILQHSYRLCKLWLST